MSSDLAPSHSSSVPRSFFCGDVIAITSWAPDVVNLMRPVLNEIASPTLCLHAGEKPAYRLYRSMPARTSPGVDVKESFGEKLDSVVYFLGRERGLWS